MDISDSEITLEFRHPTETMTATIDRSAGLLRIKRHDYGTLKVLSQLHQGKRTGATGSWLIDLSAGVLILAALSGIALFVAIPQRRGLGLSALALGVGLFVLAYFVAMGWH